MMKTNCKETVNTSYWETGINGDKYCSNCGTYAGYAYRGSTKRQELSNYCPNCGVKMNCEIEDSKSDSCYNCNKSYDMGCSECEKYCENEVTEQEVSQSCHL